MLPYGLSLSKSVKSYGGALDRDGHDGLEGKQVDHLTHMQVDSTAARRGHGNQHGIDALQLTQGGLNKIRAEAHLQSGENTLAEIVHMTMESL